ncbi:MAG: alpha/beta fold hydrolase [Candidatus Anstonellales archaeon]
MSKRLLVYLVIIVILLVGIGIYFRFSSSLPDKITLTSQFQNEGGLNEKPHPLSIVALRVGEYPGSEIAIEQTLEPGVNYKRFIASYRSEGLKIYALLTIPNEKKPEGGFPVVIFNHGYIPPAEYKTAERYTAYVDGFARAGFIVFKPDYRGHGNSEGKLEGAYYSPAYTIDILNAISSIKRYPDANPERIGMWGHSMGGNIALRTLVISKDIKAAVLWAGVVGTYEELMTKWRRDTSWRPSDSQASHHLSSIRESLQKTYGTPKDNPSFWHSIDPRFYLKDVSTPIQLHHGLADQSVPPEFSESLKNDLEKEGKTVEYYTYEGADHNISSPSFEVAMQRSVNFFNKYLKGGDAR